MKILNIIKYLFNLYANIWHLSSLRKKFKNVNVSKEKETALEPIQNQYGDNLHKFWRYQGNYIDQTVETIRTKQKTMIAFSNEFSTSPENYLDH